MSRPGNARSRTPSGDQAARPVVPTRGRLRPLGLGEVRLKGGFWGERQVVNAAATLDHCLGWIDRVGWVDNFRVVAEGRAGRSHRGPPFSDSDVYKLVEAMAWEVGRSESTAADENVRALAAAAAAAQDPDGYLNTAFGHPGQRGRYDDLEEGHELYCSGHLIQAAVARARISGHDQLVEVAVRAADHVCETFGANGNLGLCGHPEVEMALVELARLTGEQRYLDQAALFVDRRGRGALTEGQFGPVYFQDDVPVRDATVFRGHAVRALYLAAGAVDVAVETGDDELFEAIVRQWEATVARRTYITGGMGARHLDEAFGDDFALPPDGAYSETCAGVGSVMLAWRLLLATGESRYADLMERTLYNVVASSPAADGRAFFYANTLHQRELAAEAAPDRPSLRAASEMRAPWFDVSCCPTNVARTLASLAAYTATADAAGLQIHQYADADVRTVLDDGRAIGVEVLTGYPADGTIAVRVTETPPTPWSLSLRVPAWAGGDASILEPDGQVRRVPRGMTTVTRRFAVGDVVRLDLSMEPRWTVADPRIDAVRGTVAAERGPLVLCLESVDLPDGRNVDAFLVDVAVRPREEDGHVVVKGALEEPVGQPWPYGDPAPRPSSSDPSGKGGDDGTAGTDRPLEAALTPYHDRANRGPSTMRVWLRTKQDPAPHGSGRATS